METLSQAVFRKFDFLTAQAGAILFDHYSLLKDDLPDGDNLKQLKTLTIL